MDTMVEQRRKKQAHNITNMVNHVLLNDLPENCIFDILIRLPVETLHSSRFVCKSWFEIISSYDFINAHLHLSDTITRGLIFLISVENYSLPPPPPKKVFSVESNSTLFDDDFSCHIQFMEIKNGKRITKDYNTTFMGNIVAACNGLIVLKNNLARTRLIILNPITRELEDIPLGTISSWPTDLYGLAFCQVSRRYKLLHLFMDRLENLCCEIMDIGSGTWRAVGVPPTNHFYCLENPTFAMGGLHWIQYKVDRGECMVSIPLDDEKYKTMAIPETGGHQIRYKSVFSMGEFLGFAGRLPWPNDQIGVWILRGECGWEKQYNIDVPSFVLGYDVTTLLYYGGGNRRAFIFKCGGCLYAYDDHHSQPLRKIGIIVTNNWTFFPHVNSLVSWRS